MSVPKKEKFIRWPSRAESPLKNKKGARRGKFFFFENLVVLV